MKKIVLLFSLLISVMDVTAQQEINSNYATQINALFSDLDKTRVPHGILLDFGMEYTNIAAYNGTLTDSTYVNKETLKHVYNTLFMSRIVNVTSGFVNPNDREQLWKDQRSKDYIALSGLYFKYSKFIEDANTTNKLIYANDKFYDKFIDGEWQNPYQEGITFVMSSPISKYQGYNLNIKIPQTIFYSNYASEIQKIEIDFADGLGYRLTNFNELVDVNYSTEGVKIWKYKLTLTNSQTILSHSQILIEKGLDVSDIGDSQVMRAEPISNDGIYGKITIPGEIPFLGQTASTTVLIDYASSDRKIRKPLIVAEGFDTGTLYNPENVYGDLSIRDFQRAIFNSSGNELSQLLVNNYFAPYDQQYDIIYVNWNNGTDYLQRNAYALEEVIRWVNAEKLNNGSTQQNVVLGQSMGGVIARFILKDMEQRGIAHQTRLFISQDAPQQGANIPISLQFMFRHLTNLYDQVPTPWGITLISIPYLENSILDTPAAKQLLSNWSTPNYSLINTYNTDFFSILTAKGYPSLSRNIAISNGSECGNNQNFNPNDDLVNFSYNKGLSFWGDLLSLVYNPLGGLIAGTATGNGNFNAVSLLGLVPGHSRYKVDFNAKALSYSTNQIYNGKISYTKKILWIGPSIIINITNKQKNQPAGLLPMDTYGGGFYNTNLLSGNTAIPNDVYIRDRFNFIPTASALDIGGKFVTLDDADYKMAYVSALPPTAPKNTSFSNFTTAFSSPNINNNEAHISFNTRNGNWMAKELNSNPETTNCSFVCSDSQISGTENVCMTANYTAPQGATTYTWSITQGNNLVTISGNGTNSIVLNKTSPNASGSVTLNLNFGSATCGFRTITKVIWVGAAPFSISRGIAESETCDIKYHYVPFIINLPPNTYLSFNYLYPNVRYSQNGNTYTFQFLKNYSGPFTIIATATNSCGTYTVDYDEGFYINNCSWVGSINSNSNTSNDTSYYTVYPNPTNDVINVSLVDDSQKPVSTSKIIAELYDFTGQPKQKVEIKNNIVSINCSGLTKGIYILKISIEGNIESHQVIVK